MQRKTPKSIVAVDLEFATAVPRGLKTLEESPELESDDRTQTREDDDAQVPGLLVVRHEAETLIEAFRHIVGRHLVRLHPGRHFVHRDSAVLVTIEFREMI